MVGWTKYVIPSSTNERVEQWLERDALPIDVTACRGVSNSAWLQEFQRNIMIVSPLSILGHYFDVESLGKALYPHMLQLIQV